MIMNRKKIIIVSGIILGVLIIGLLIYFSFSNKPSQKTTPPITTPTLTTPENSVTPASLSKIISSISGFTWSNTDQKFWAVSNSGILYSIDPATFSVSTTTNLGLSNVIGAQWSGDKTKIMLSYADNGSIKNSVFDNSNQTITTLPSQASNIAFSPTNNQIAYVFNQTKNGSLETFISTASFDGSKWKNIISLPVPDALLYWSTPKTIYLTSPASGLVPNSVYSINSSGNGALQEFLPPQNGQQLVFSPSGTKILYSYTDSYGKNIQLFYKDLKNNAAVLLPFKTLAQKCSFNSSETIIYCGVPTNFSAGSIWPDDYYNNKITPSDSVWEYSIESNSASIIAPSDQFTNLDLENPIIPTSDGSAILFIQKNTGDLMRLSIIK